MMPGQLVIGSGGFEGTWSLQFKASKRLGSPRRDVMSNNNGNLKIWTAISWFSLNANCRSEGPSSHKMSASYVTATCFY